MGAAASLTGYLRGGSFAAMHMGAMHMGPWHMGNA